MRNQIGFNLSVAKKERLTTTVRMICHLEQVSVETGNTLLNCLKSSGIE